jgi:hypothetical protein
VVVVVEPLPDWSVVVPVVPVVLVPLVVEEASSFLQAANARPPTRASTVRILIDILIREPPD